MINFSPLKVLIPVLLIALTACSSGMDKQEQLEAIARHRADILSANLPIEHGPLTVMQAKSHGRTVTLMMLYNGQKPIDELLKSSIHFYCANKEIKTNLELGLEYQIKMRNPRGKLLVDQRISASSCAENQ
ncbi:hypothetical protein CSW98_01745 [Vibrio sp. HA2012]|uniref:GspS/AspS pilotin family protein n=1 Tax=Vibrio sp. HA2012 TaxID=1971595 RepID=UPI000C2C6661|nr:GspS/AspS pilotin family protein [Vibrio sp. HA2012]PJC87873.1 hypothetical protein CSW98_01745 [Vibrio sp. HA2012]